VGRIDDLRQRMFHKSILITTVDSLPDPDRLFSAIDDVVSWTKDDNGGYVLVVSDVRVAAPAITRALVAAGADVLSLAEGHHSLEEVYLELVGAAGQGGEQ